MPVPASRPNNIPSAPCAQWTAILLGSRSIEVRPIIFVRRTTRKCLTRLPLNSTRRSKTRGLRFGRRQAGRDCTGAHDSKAAFRAKITHWMARHGPWEFGWRIIRGSVLIWSRLDFRDLTEYGAALEFRHLFGGAMISGAHVVVYSKNAEADRAFFRDVLGFKSVDAGHGWLIFALPPAEAAIHPSDAGGIHELYFMCDDLKAEMASLAKKGVKCSKVEEQRWGSITKMRLPGGGELGLYQPKHPTALGLK